MSTCNHTCRLSGNVKRMPKQAEGLQPLRVRHTLANEESEVKPKRLKNNNNNKCKREKEPAPLNHARKDFIQQRFDRAVWWSSRHDWNISQNPFSGWSKCAASSASLLPLKGFFFFLMIALHQRDVCRFFFSFLTRQQQCCSVYRKSCVDWHWEWVTSEYYTGTYKLIKRSSV